MDRPPSRRRLRASALVVLVVLAGCAGAGPPVAGDDPDVGNDRGTWQWPDDPAADTVGWEAGYWYNESIEVNQSDGLSAAEREAYVARTMARVEVIREREFASTVPVEVVSRDAYRERNVFTGDGDRDVDQFDEQVWEAQFLIDEETTVGETFGALYGSNVLGYYSPGEDRIVVVSDSPTPAVDRATLAHELVHALQDQTWGLPPAGRTRDADLARDGLVEGDARLVESMYERRCVDGTWDCVPRPPREGGGPVPNRGVLLTVLQPYSDGPTLVNDVRKRGGWDAVDAMYDDVPASTEQVIHPEAYPDETPRDVTVPDRSRGSWAPIRSGRTAGTTLGEASIFAAFEANGILAGDTLTEGTGAFSYYNYSHPRSDGWAGDRIVPYADGDGGYGYVWATEWDTTDDAERFRSSYVLLLKLRHGARFVDDGVYAIESGPYADAFRVTREGDRVVVVNAPTVGDLPRVHAPGG